VVALPVIKATVEESKMIPVNHKWPMDMDMNTKMKGLMLEEGLTGYLFGGVIRDIVMKGPMEADPKDLDTIVDGPNDNWKKMGYTLLSTAGLKVKKSSKYETQYSAISGEIAGQHIDIWPIQNQWSLPEKHRQIDNVTKSIFLTTEAILATFGNDAHEIVVIESGFFDNMNRGTIDGVDWQRSNQMYAIKALLQHLQLGLEMTPRLDREVGYVLRTMNVDNVKREVNKRLGNRPDVVKQIMAYIADI
jgi:hypothetical protein